MFNQNETELKRVHILMHAAYIAIKDKLRKNSEGGWRWENWWYENGCLMEWLEDFKRLGYVESNDKRECRVTVDGVYYIKQFLEAELRHE